MKENSISTKSQTDWARIDAMTDQDIDTSDIPPITPELFATAIVRQGLKPMQVKKQVTIRLDADVLIWFKAQGQGYQTQINELLRAYMNASRVRES